MKNYKTNSRFQNKYVTIKIKTEKKKKLIFVQSTNLYTNRSYSLI